jgi:hypothetical protein
MVLAEDGDRVVHTARGEMLRHRGENMALRSEIIETKLRSKDPWDFATYPVPVRPLPEDDSWYETTWRDYETGRVFGL